MTALFGLLYGVFLLTLFALGAVIVFHLIRYTPNRRSATTLVVVFSVITALLFFANIFLFSTIPFSQLFGLYK